MAKTSIVRLQSELANARQDYRFWARQEQRLTRDEYAQKMQAERRIRELEVAIAKHDAGGGAVLLRGRSFADEARRVLGDERYAERYPYPKWNVQPTVLMEPRLFPRVFPELAKADHLRLAREFRVKADKVKAQHEKWVTRGERTYGTNGPFISGGFHNDWPESVKETIRRLAHEASLLADAAHAHAAGAKLRRYHHTGERA